MGVYLVIRKKFHVGGIYSHVEYVTCGGVLS